MKKNLFRKYPMVRFLYIDSLSPFWYWWVAKGGEELRRHSTQFHRLRTSRISDYKSFRVRVSPFTLATALISVGNGRPQKVIPKVLQKFFGDTFIENWQFEDQQVTIHPRRKELFEDMIMLLALFVCLTIGTSGSPISQVKLYISVSAQGACKI